MSIRCLSKLTLKKLNKINHWPRLISQIWDRTTSYSLNLRAFRPTLKIRYFSHRQCTSPVVGIWKKRWHSLFVTTCIQFDWSQNDQTTDDHRHCSSPVTAIRKVHSPSILWEHLNIWLVTNHGRHPYPHLALPSLPKNKETRLDTYHWCVENNPHRWTPQRRRRLST